MMKYWMLILCFSSVSFGMEDKNKEKILQLYNRDILPHMPAFTKVTQEKGVATLLRLAQTSFDNKRPQWTFNHTFTWMRENVREADMQADIAILKRYVAAIIDRADASNNLQELAKEIVGNRDSLRWVVIADSNSAVSPEQIADRWNQFITAVRESIPMQLQR